VLVLEGDLVLDLLELGLNPGIGLVAVGVEPRKSLETLLNSAVVDKPAGRLAVCLSVFAILYALLEQLTGISG
jgi:hypothetical protein